MTHATETVNGPARPALVMAMDLGRGQWRLGFAIGAARTSPESPATHAVTTTVHQFSGLP
jgi:hypothetical protein